MTMPNEMKFGDDGSVPLSQLLASLSQPDAFPATSQDDPVKQITVKQTHISVVFISDDVVYKLKKPVKLPFLDFSTLPLREHFCHEEVRINRPWAPGIYLEAVPVRYGLEGFHFEGEGQIVDWAVKMKRLPESVTLRSRLTDGSLTTNDLERVAKSIAQVHQDSARTRADEAERAIESFTRQWNDNWSFAETLPADIIPRDMTEKLQALSTYWMNRLRDVLRLRGEQGWIRDVHGDLRLEHVFLFPDQAPPHDIVIIDGIEFDPTLRQIDIAADMAFLTMELSFLGHRDLAEIFADSYFKTLDDQSGRELLTLFAVYRSAVRGKVAAILGCESEVSQAEREQAFARSRAHWLWCFSELEQPSSRPALVLVSGLPGTGKSTLARCIAEQAHFEVLRSDVIRKEIFPVVQNSRSSPEVYSHDGTQRVYNECLSRAAEHLRHGGRVIVDATFQREDERQRFLQLAIDHGCRSVWLECIASPEITKQRIEARHGDASDADWPVHQLVKSRWEQPSETTARFHVLVETGESCQFATDAAIAALREFGIAR